MIVLGTEFWKCVNTEPANEVKSDRWVKDAKGWWYRRADGSYPKDQWLLLDAWYYFDSYGYALRNQWKYIKGLWYYFGDDCRMSKGWIKLDGHWYYLNPTAGAKPEGAMLTGWQKIGSYWYFLRPARDGDHPEGSAATEWIRDDLYWYYLLPEKKAASRNAQWRLAGNRSAASGIISIRTKLPTNRIDDVLPLDHGKR